MHKSIIFSFAILSFALLQISCNEPTTNNYYQGDSDSSSNADYRVVTNIPTSIISFTDMANVPKGTIMKLRVNRNDFEV